MVATHKYFFEFFTPDPWGFMIQFDGCICFFNLGWFNHQPDKQKRKWLKWWNDLTWNMGKVNLCRERILGNWNTQAKKDQRLTSPIFDFFLPSLDVESRVQESMRLASERPRPQRGAWCQVENSFGGVFFNTPKQDIYQLQNGNESTLSN